MDVVKKTFQMKCTDGHKFTLTEEQAAAIPADEIPVCPKCMMPAYVLSVKVRA